MKAPIDVPAKGDFGAAFGAARLGLVAAEEEEPANILTTPPIAESIEPSPALAERYQESYAHWRKIYPAVREVMR